MSAVLIVDDEERTREVLNRWLTGSGFEIGEAPDAETAIRMMADRAYDVVTIDKDMPGQGGLWLVEQIQQRYPAVAMLLASGDAGIGPRVSLSKGVLGYLVKPLNREHVLVAVKEAAQWHEAAAKNAVPEQGGADPIDAWLRGRAGRPPQDHSQK